MKKHARIIAVLLAALTMTAVLCACGDGKGVEPTSEATQEISSPAEPVGGGEIIVGIAQDLDDSLDPHRMTAAGTREVLFNVFEGLVKPDSDGNLIPAVASDYIISESGDTFTFTLRDGVRFHNGNAVTVGDVVYSITRAAGLDTGEPLVEQLSDVASVEARDDKTVVIKTAQPNIETLAFLTAAIIPEGGDPAETPVGTGPFKLVSRSALENVVVEKFEDYWGEPAYLDKVTFQIISSPETLVMSLKSGAVDMAIHLTSTQTAELPDMTILEGTMNLVQAVYLNHNVEPLNDIRVRQALCHVLNRGDIMAFIADGRGTALGSSMYPAFGKYFMPELADYYDYDIEKAKSLLAEAGYAGGFDLTITVPSAYTPHVNTAQVIAEQFKAIGVNVTINQVEWATWLSDVYQGRQFEATIIGFDAANMTASAMLDRWHSGHGSNMINFANAEYDETLENAHAATDDAEQTELYKRCEEILAEQAANVYIQDLCDLVAMKRGLAGYEFYPLYVMDMAKVYFTE